MAVESLREASIINGWYVTATVIGHTVPVHAVCANWENEDKVAGPPTPAVECIAPIFAAVSVTALTLSTELKCQVHHFLEVSTAFSCRQR